MEIIHSTSRWVSLRFYPNPFDLPLRDAIKKATSVKIVAPNGLIKITPCHAVVEGDGIKVLGFNPILMSGLTPAPGGLSYMGMLVGGYINLQGKQLTLTLTPNDELVKAFTQSRGAIMHFIDSIPWLLAMNNLTKSDVRNLSYGKVGETSISVQHHTSDEVVTPVGVIETNVPLSVLQARFSDLAGIRDN